MPDNPTSREARRYRCPVCGIADENAYLRCYDGGCPDGRDTLNRRRDPDVEEKNRRLFAGPPPTYYTTPPDFKQCMNYREHGPTPCWHPHCNCFKATKLDCAAIEARCIAWVTGVALVFGGFALLASSPWVTGVALVFGGFALLASSFFGYFR
jgi:hypothetical protein